MGVAVSLEKTYADQIHGFQVNPSLEATRPNGFFQRATSNTGCLYIYICRLRGAYRQVKYNLLKSSTFI